ncbi:DUF7527 domain-containing protein [Haloterrigena alkaliphila]|uniref:Transcriptional regulator n=1 Tax=Haloterrigena alkaliphila TaxID=2816475 RepID=A0A8A2V8W1_9EURY|nr:transcriptional regulator [Haloterrigena alkaliphila]QSW98353.1 transcriptional regulator [Haloterrigena alkaliphila]
MDPRTQERVERWDSRPFNGGYDGLTDLADADFSGAVAAAGTWLFMLNGRVVGVFDGTIEDFDGASGTAHEAPDPALPLLCTMEERGGETRANYYTNETPLREVDETLQNGSFTGYVKLSENVLSGDYYTVYYGGRRMAAAYIGNAERLLTGEEAFERAADEVGIYEVVDVEIEVTDVSGAASDGPDESGSDADAGSNAGAGSTAGADAETGSSEPERTEPSTDPTESAVESIDISGSEPETAADAGGTAAPIEDVSFDEAAIDGASSDSADAPSGITATDDANPDPEPASSGITDTGVGTDATESPADDDHPDVQAAIGEVDSETPDETEAQPTTETTVEEAVEPAASKGPDAADIQADGDQRASTTDPETDTETSDSSPDLAEVEAAAEQLDQNDISWTEDDVDSTTDEESTTETASAVAADTATEAAADAPENEERFEEEAQWRETRSIPSIDPDNSETADSTQRGAAGRDGTTQRGTGRSSEADRSDGRSRGTAAGSTQTSRQRQSDASGQRAAQRTDRAEAKSPGTAESGSSSGGAANGGRADERVAELTQRIETLEAHREKLAAKAEELETERDELQSENEELSSTVDRLQSRIEELEAELKRARESGSDGGDATPSASTTLSPQRALADTNLFVRYVSKSQPTLESAHDGDADRTDVASNLRLEHHTGFDAADVAVDGRPYETFLTETMEHRFVDWLTEMLLFEIRDTGSADALADLYDAIPRIDRAELGATLSLEEDDTEDVPDQVTFDVVAFDKMGNPLVVANLNDSRDPATQGMLEEMEEAASAVKANYPDLAAAVVVTSSYFEPGALEVAEQATSGGLLSRGSKLSYVNLSRKQGYHLCLVESRSEGFHMNVPEL